MKRFAIYILAAGLTFQLASCQKDILDQTPETSLSDVEFWKSSNDLKLYANNFYDAMFPAYTDYGTLGIFSEDANTSDNMIGNGYSTVLNGETVLPGSGAGWAYEDWQQLRNINYFLTNYSKVDATPETVNPYVGEVLFFRAMFYFDKLKKFGDLPWISTVLEPNSPEVFAGRLPRNVIVDSIMNDLDKAVNYLPTHSSAQPSRINKEVAQLLQARIALYEGTWERYHAGTAFGVEGSDGTVFIEKAAAVSEALVSNSGGYGLIETPGEMGYWNIFNQVDYSNNPEVMLWRAYDLNQTAVHRWHSYSIGGAGIGITKDMMDAYLCVDGKPIAVSKLYKGDNTLLDAAANRDPRLRQSVYIPDEKHIITENKPGGAAAVLFQRPAFVGPATEVSSTGYQVYKGHSAEYSQQQGQSTTGLILFRYAEALLIYAEAKTELGTFNQADADISINLLRRRVGMPDLKVGAIVADPNQEFPNISSLLNEIRRERRVELAFEGYRGDDLHRWAAMGLKIKGWKPLGAKKAQWAGQYDEGALDAYPVNADGYIEFFQKVGNMPDGYKFNEKRDYLSPIPLDQITLNKDNIYQNPGWN